MLHGNGNHRGDTPLSVTHLCCLCWMMRRTAAVAPARLHLRYRYPLSLDVVDLKAEYGIKDSEYYRSKILGKLATDTYTEGDLQQWVDLHEAISNLFYPPVKEFSSDALVCSNCGSSPLKGVKEPDFLVWCPACHQTWTMEDYEAEIVSQLTDPLP